MRQSGTTKGIADSQETRLTAELPNLNVEIVMRQFPEQRTETMTIHLTAGPGFDAVARALAGGLASCALPPLARLWFAPLYAWMNAAQVVWAPLLASSPLAPVLEKPQRGR